MRAIETFKVKIHIVYLIVNDLSIFIYFIFIFDLLTLHSNIIWFFVEMIDFSLVMYARLLQLFSLL